MKRCSWIHDHKPWTPSEEEFLRAHRGTMTSAAMAAALPGRTKEAVKSRCSQLQIFKRDLRPSAPIERLNARYWSGPEIAVLRRHGRSRPSFIKQRLLPHRSADAIGQMISRLRIRHHSQQRLPVIRIPEIAAEQQVAA